MYQKVGELRSAQEAMDGALAIRRSLHTRDAGKHLFSKELQQGERTKLEIEQKRRTLRLGLQAKIRKGVLVESFRAFGVVGRIGRADAGWMGVFGFFIGRWCRGQCCL